MGGSVKAVQGFFWLYDTNYFLSEAMGKQFGSLEPFMQTVPKEAFVMHCAVFLLCQS